MPTYLAAAERWVAVLDAHYWDRRCRRLRLHRRRHARRDRAHARRPRRRHAQRQRDHDLQPGGAPPADGQAAPTSTAPRRSRRPSPPTSARNALGHCGLLAGVFDLLAPQHVVVIEPRAGDAAALAAGARHVRPVAAGRRAAGGRAGQTLASPALAGKTADRRQAHRLRLPRPAMLAARDRPGHAARTAPNATHRPCSRRLASVPLGKPAEAIRWRRKSLDPSVSR